MPSAGAEARAAKRAAGGARLPGALGKGFSAGSMPGGPGTEKSGRQDGHGEQGDKVSSWLSPPDIRQAQSPQGLQGASCRKAKPAVRRVGTPHTLPSEPRPWRSEAHSSRTVCKGAGSAVLTLTFSSVRPFSTESATFCRMRCRNA